VGSQHGWGGGAGCTAQPPAWKISPCWAEQAQCPRKGVKCPGQQNPSSNSTACPGSHLGSSVSTPAQALPEASPARYQQLSHCSIAPGEGPAEQFPPCSPVLSQGCWGLSVSETSAPLSDMGLDRWVLLLGGGRVKVHEQAHASSHTEKFWLKKPLQLNFHLERK